ncbi:MAG: phosphoribosylanthranilate isomerase [Terriglobales bacterium]
MDRVPRPRIKICCIANLGEAKLAIRYGAAALGFVSPMPSGPGVISEEQIAHIVAQVPPPIATFLLTSRQTSAAIIAQHQVCRTNTIQICDRLGPDALRDLKRALPGIALVPVIHVVGPESIEEALAVAPQASAILLDSGRPALAIKELGGTGRKHDWALSRQIRERIDVPLFLAGGLNSSNVRQAIDEVGPFGLDICTGVRTNGELDENKLAALFAALETAQL